ncbi:MAG: phosphodiester glycosidase family protein [Clostridia bacterium]|nr:phosphodiester glycosidase family protein [Clostridia bacterium]
MNRKKGNKPFIKNKSFILIMAVSLGISVFLCACNKTGTNPVSTSPTESPAPVQTVVPTPSATAKPTEKPEQNEPAFEYEEKVLEINGRQSHVFLLTVDIGKPNVRVVPYLAFGRIFGFEYLQSMAEATSAVAAVNAGFFFEYGRPSGLVVNNGEIISAGTGKFYSLVIDEGKARFEVIKTDITLLIDGKSIEIETFNMSPGSADAAVFSDAYGATDRLGYHRSTLIINDGEIIDFRRAESPAEIPDGGYVVMLPADYPFESNPTGKPADIVFSPAFGENAMAYECASMLVEDGRSLAGDSMPWVGNLNQYDPRTCVGIMKDGKLGFIVIDGRQPDYSSGATGRETADVLIDLGFTDAVMLDGGGSSQMIIEGRTVNSPSSGPEGRPIAGGFMVIIGD